MNKKQNLVYICVDGLRYDTPLSCMGRLIKSSCKFTNAFSTHPLTKPYTASVFSGKYSTSTEVVNEITDFDIRSSALYTILTENGYNVIFATPSSDIDKLNLTSPFALFVMTDSLLPSCDNSVTEDTDYLPECEVYTPRDEATDDTKRPSEIKEKYLSEAEKADRYINSLLTQLEAYENCVTVLTSSHGTLLGEHGKIGANVYYDEAAHVPFYVSADSVKADSECHSYLGSVDIMPTILSLMGLKDCIPEDAEGMILLGDDAKIKDATMLMGLGTSHGWTDGYEWRAYVTDDYTYAIYLRDGMEFLFDNKNDRLQENSLILDKEHFEKKVELRNKLYSEMNRIDDKFHTSKYYKTVLCGRE